MNLTVAALTLRQLMGRRRTLLLGTIGLLMVLIAVAYRLGGPAEGEARDWTTQLLANFGVATLLPIVALIVGTGALGAEIDDGTLPYLLAKPISRREIVLTKLVVAIVLAGVLIAIPMAASALIAAGAAGPDLALAFGVAAVAGAAAYCALFLALSLVTSRAFVLGLAYVLIWEGFLAALFAGTRPLSIRQQTLAVADALADVSDVIGTTLEPITALIVGAAVLVLATILAVRRLAEFEIRGEEA